MRVYRYEHRTAQCGPYRPAGLSVDHDRLSHLLAEMHCPDPTRCCWHDDAVLRQFHNRYSEGGPMKAACSTLEAVQYHFAGLHDILRDFGYELVELELPDGAVVVGENPAQVAFNGNMVSNRKVLVSA